MKISEETTFSNINDCKTLIEELESELFAVKNILSSIKNNSPDYIIRYNRDLQIIFASASLCDALHTAEEHILGKTNIEIGIPASSADLWNKTMMHVLRRGKTKRVEFELPQNGSKHYFEAVIVPEKTKNRKFENVLSIVRDVTAKKKSEDQNKRLQKNLESQKNEMAVLLARDEAILNKLSDGVIISDATGELIYMNESSRCFHDIFDDNDLKKYKTNHKIMFEFYDTHGKRVHENEMPLQKTLRKEIFTDIETMIKNAHTGKIWYSSFSGSPVFDDTGNFIFSVLTVRDITERENMINRLKSEKQAIAESEMLVKKDEERFRKMFELHKAVMLLIDPETGSIVNANQAASDFYMYSREELMKMNIHDINMLSRNEVEAEWQKALKEERNYFVFPHKVANGQQRWVEVYSSPFDAQNKKLLFSIIHDITERRRAEQQLKESRDDLKLAQSVVRMGSWRMNIIKNELLWSDEAYRIFAIQFGTPLTYEIFLSFIHPEDREFVDKKWKDALKGAEYNIEHRIVVEDKIKWVRETAILEFDEEGNMIGGFGTVQDITKRKEAELERERLLSEVMISEQRLKLALQTGKGGAWEWDLINDTIIWSTETYNLTGIEPGFPVDYSFILKLIDDRDKESVLQILADGISKKKEIKYEFRTIHPLKGERCFESHGKVLYDVFGVAVRIVGVSMDITEQKQTEITLRQQAESLKFLSGTATKMLVPLNSSELMKFVADSLYSVAGGAIIFFSGFDPINKKLTVRELRSTNEEKIKIREVFGRNPEGLTFDFPDEIRSRIIPGELDFLEGGIYELVFGQMPEPVCRILEKELNIQGVFAMACTAENDILGTVAVLSHEPAGELRNKNVIESVVNQAALAFKRIRVEDYIHESEEKFAAAFRSNPNGLLLTNLEDGLIIDANDSFLNIIGYKKEELIGKSTLSINTYLDASDRGTMIETLNGNGYLRDYELKIKSSSGSDRTVLISAELISISGRKTLLSTIQDITDRKKMEQELDQLARFPEENPNPVLRVDLSGIVLYANNASNELLQLWNTGKGKKIPSSLNKIVTDSIENRRQETIEVICNEIIYSFVFMPVIKSEYVNMYGTDITDRKHAELKISEQAHFISSITETVPDMISVIELQSNKLLYVNREPFNEQGFYADDMMKMSQEERRQLLHTDDILPIADYFKSFETMDDHGVSTLEYRAKNFNHEWMWFRARGKVFERDHNGNVKSCLNIVQNITEQKKAGEKLVHALNEAEEGKNILNALMEYIPVGITIADAPDVKIKMISKYGQDLLEKSSDEIVGIPAPEHPSKWGVYHADGLTPGTPEELPLTRATVNGEIVKNEEWLITRNNGTFVPILCNAAPIRDKEGNITGGVIGWQDITEIRKSRQQLKTQAMMLEQVHDAIFAMDSSNRIIYMNHAALKQYEIKNPELVIGSKLGDYFSLEWMDNAQKTDFSRSLQKKNVWKGENFYTTSKGRMFWAESVISGTKDESGKRTGLVAIVRDISERKQMEEQLQKKNDHLTRINELLEDFVHIAAHDLRGPIGNIMVMSDYIDMQPTIEGKMETFNHLSPLVKKLGHTVDGLLETVNVQKENENNFTRLLFKDVMNYVLEDCTIDIKRYNVHIKTDFKIEEIDYVEAYLVSIMKNLISNAIKYSADKDKPVIKISTKKEKDHILLTISDNGIGIDLESAGENIFKPFKRFTSKASGTGMGLYIVKNIIEKNGGNIFVESKLNEGTTFYCLLNEYTLGFR